MTDIPWCPVAATVDVIGGKWKPVILLQLKDGPRRFNELRRLLPHITQRMLTLQLRALEADGVIVRTVHEQVPPHVDYAFSPRGLTLGPLLEAMWEWGEAYGSRTLRAAEV
ncbi:helix-turn-helix domain-containing protein [Phenylobacterium sp.]|uniref:winged helix-turn-helix transcriptional regulator n=1 Tax=Phenylobacterium sp. TaxID=1871053 RepID=UPI00286C2306|nr:helix-turn-helix domain-containing protein [Phenylobacterium sp.]